MLKLEDIYDVTVARDGQEAYEMVKASMDLGLVFNLIFMDIQMPNLDGLQSTRLIRQMGYSAPIVALTAFAEESNVKECMESGMDMFLSKPIRRPALKQVLKKFATIPEEEEVQNEKERGEDKAKKIASAKERKDSSGLKDSRGLKQQLKERRGAANTQSENGSVQGDGLAERGREDNPMFPPKAKNVAELQGRSNELGRDDSVSPMSMPAKPPTAVTTGLPNGEGGSSENTPTPP